MTIRALFWDVGGVLLTNAWDHIERKEAIARFHLDKADFQARHDPLVPDFERGKLTLDEYLQRTVFYCERPFSPEEFKQFMFSLSQPIPGMLEFVRQLSASGKYWLGTINNESRELNLYRIQQYGMRAIFRVFFSSCFVGLRKPDPAIYRLALETTQIEAESAVFIDDRSENLTAPAQLGIHTIQMKTLDQLRADLEKIGVCA